MRIILLRAIVEDFWVAYNTDPPTTVINVSWMTDSQNHSWQQITVPGDHSPALKKGVRIEISANVDDVTIPTPFDTANARA
jgi:hypothetical protein